MGGDCYVTRHCHFDCQGRLSLFPLPSRDGLSTITMTKEGGTGGLLKWSHRVLGSDASSLKKRGYMLFHLRELHQGQSTNRDFHQARWGGAYNALLFCRHDAVSDPKAPSTHHVGHHDVGAETVADDSHLRRVRHARFGILAKVLHDLGAAPGLLGRMGQDGQASCPFKLARENQTLVMGCSTGRVRHNEEAAAGICGLQLLEAFLWMLSAA